jgi:diaminopimelate epimerase
MNTIRFAKMHGLGNDFMVIDTLQQAYEPSAQCIRAWSDRHTGVGFDQLLLITPPPRPDVDFGYRIFNADGAEVQQCGNGARCAAIYVHKKDYSTQATLRFATQAGVLEVICLANQQVRVNMGIPNFMPASLPFTVPTQQAHYELAVNDEQIVVGAVSMGNPHIVLAVPHIATAPVIALGAQLTHHPLFPEGVNVGFMEITNRATMQLRVYERGVGETQACGSGACAAMVLGRLWQLLDDTVTVRLPGGCLTVQWEGAQMPVWMTGPATWVYEGDINECI